MNAATTRKISFDELLALTTAAFERLGAPAEQADVAARMCVEAEAMGRTSHGVRLVQNVRREYVRGADRRRPLAVLQETPTSAVVDGGFQLSPWVHATAAELVADKASVSGIGLVAVRNAGVSGALGLFAQAIARHGHVGVALNGSPSVVVPPGSSTPMLGTNPVAIAVPVDGSEPLVLDMATSAIAFNKVVVALHEGTPLPADVAVDGDGHMSTDPRAVTAADGRGRLLPFGGHRGFGLSLMLEMMLAAGVSGDVGEDKLTDFMPEPEHFPGLYLAYRPDLFLEPGAFERHAWRLADQIRELGARLPGDVSGATRRSASESGMLDVSVATFDMISEL